MANEIARLIVAFEAQSAQYVKTMNELRAQNAKFHADTVSTISKVKNAFAALGVAAVVTETVHFIRSQIEAVAAIGKMADAANIGAEELQRLQFAFKTLTTATAEQTQRGLNTFNANLGKARSESGKLRDTFVALGVNLRSATPQALEQTFKGLAKIEDASKRATLAGVLFTTRFGVKVAGALKDGTKAMEDAKAAAKDIFTDAETEKSKEVEEQFIKIGKAFDHAAASAILENADAITSVGEALGVVFGWYVKILGKAREVGSSLGQSIGQLVYQGKPVFDPNLPGGGDPFNSATQNHPRGATGDFGPTDEQIAAKKAADDAAAKAAKDASDIQIEDAKATAKYLAAKLKAQNEYTMSIYNTVAALEKEAIEQGMGRTQKTLLELQTSGANDATMAQAKHALALLDVGDALDKMFEKEHAWSNAEKEVDAMLEKEHTSAQKALKQTSVFAEEAARNMQDAFANFLFKPFDKGVKGMLQGFLEILQQLAAQMAASAIFKQLAGLQGQGGVLGAIGDFAAGAQRASGGPVSAGGSYLVGERGPEMFTPRASGTIIPNGGGGAVIVNQSIAVGQGVTPPQLIAAMKIAKDTAKAEIVDMLGRPR